MMLEEFPEIEAPLETVGHDACLRLLAATQFGRLAVVVDGKPVIVVLNHLTVDGHVVFRTGEHAVVSQLTTDGSAIPAVYEVDSSFPAGRSGWSVIAAGSLAREDDPARAAATRDRIATWADGEHDTVLRLTVEQLSGRRAGPVWGMAQPE